MLYHLLMSCKKIKKTENGCKVAWNISMMKNKAEFETVKAYTYNSTKNLHMKEQLE